MRKSIVSLTVLLLLSSIAILPANAALDSWTQKAPMPFASYFLGAATVNGKIYAIGGSFSSSGFNTTQEYNPQLTRGFPKPQYQLDCQTEPTYPFNLQG